MKKDQLDISDLEALRSLGKDKLLKFIDESITLAQEKRHKSSETESDGDNLEQLSVRFHPELVKLIKQEARNEKKKLAKFLRGVFAAGLKAKGIEFDESWL